MTFKQLQYFMSVARSLSFTEAAQEQYISQSALSRSIAALEEELGVSLLDRDHHSVRLTPAGNLLASELPNLRKELERVMLLLKQTENGMMGHLNIGVLEGQSIDEAMQVTFKYFGQSLPLVKVNPLRLNYTELLDGLERGALDLVMTMAFSLEKRRDLQTLELSCPACCVVLPAGHRLANRASRPLTDFRQETFVVTGEDSPETRHFQEVCKKAGFTPLCQSAPDLRTKLLWIESGLAISLFNADNRACHTAGLHAVELTDVPPAAVVLAWRTDTKNPSVRMFTHITQCCV